MSEDPIVPPELAAQIISLVEPKLGLPWVEALEQSKPLLWFPVKPAPAGYLGLRDYKDSITTALIHPDSVFLAIELAAKFWLTFLAGEQDAEAILISPDLDFNPGCNGFATWVFSNLSITYTAERSNDPSAPPVYRVWWQFRAAGIKGAQNGQKEHQRSGIIIPGGPIQRGS